MKCGSTLLPTGQGDGQKQNSHKPGRNHLQRSRRNELVITAHIDGCPYVLLSMHEVGRTLFFKQERRLSLIGSCQPLNMEYQLLKKKKRLWPGSGPRVTVSDCEPGPQGTLLQEAVPEPQQRRRALPSPLCSQARLTSPISLHTCRS